MEHHPIVYTDVEIETLRLEVKSLETYLQLLSDEKTEAEKLIHEFGVRHNKELGELIVEILKLRKDTAQGTPQQAEAENDYYNFYNSYEASKEEKSFILTEKERAEIKEKYRKASKLCHPDVVADNQKNIAHKVFMQLKDAYETNDLEKVKELLEILEQGKMFVSKTDTATEKLSLQLQLQNIRLRIAELEKEIKAIKSSKTYKKIIEIESWDDFFNVTQQELYEQLNQLKNGRE